MGKGREVGAEVAGTEIEGRSGTTVEVALFVDSFAEEGDEGGGEDWEEHATGEILPSI